MANPAFWKNHLVAPTSSRLSSFKDYIGTSYPAQKQHHTSNAHNRWRPEESRSLMNENEKKHSWRAWAGQKLVRLKGGVYNQPGSRPPSTETLNLFPGWAVRRFRTVEPGGVQEAFEVEVFVSGFGISYRSLKDASRSQRAFIRLAKSFASLPKEIQIQQLKREIVESEDSFDDDDGVINGLGSDLNSENTSTLRKLHANLESRLEPFWSSVIAARTVRLRLFASPHHQDDGTAPYGPLGTRDVLTAADGSFQVRFVVSWEDLCQHPDALHIAFGHKLTEHNLFVTAELLPIPLPRSISLSHIPGSSDPQYPSVQPSVPRPPVSLRLSITNSPIRVISDIDDTVKLSNVLLGARAVFHTVFVKNLRDIVIPGMGEWYGQMWERGVRFHYVSNSPYELLPVITDFFQISRLPPGSIKLKSYSLASGKMGGRALFGGLLGLNGNGSFSEPPAQRKRSGVIDVLDAFPESRFALIGDTGEQDLELYTEIAASRPTQILAVLLRDADSDCKPLDDPTGCRFTRAATTPITSASARVGNAGFTSLGSLDEIDETPRPKYRRTLSSLLSGNSTSTISSKSFLPPVGTAGSGPPGPAFLTPTPVITTEPEPLLPSTAPKSAPVSSSNNAHPLPPSPRSQAQEKRPPLRLTYPSSSSSSSSSSSTSSITSSYRRMSAYLSETEKHRQALQTRVCTARRLVPRHIPLRVFKDPRECVEMEEILENAQPPGASQVNGDGPQ